MIYSISLESTTGSKSEDAPFNSSIDNSYACFKPTNSSFSKVNPTWFSWASFKATSLSSNSFINDLKYYKSARIIAGIDGTGLHNVGFMQHSNRYMIELKHRSKRFLPKNKGLATGQFFFNWFNDVPYTVIPCFRLSYDEIEKEIEKIIINIYNSTE